MWNKLFAFTHHSFILAWSYKLNFASHYIVPAASVLLFFFLGRLFNQAGVTVVEGGSYFTYLLIGGAFSRYLELGIRAFAESLREEMLMGTIEPLLATATPIRLALLAPSAWILIEGTLLMFFQLGIGALFGADFSRANWLSAIIVALAGILSVLSWGVLSAAYTLVFKRSDPINWFIGSIAYVFSGVFFPVSILPPPLQVVSALLPFTYTLRGLRGAMLNGATPAELLPDLLALFLFTGVLLPLALWSMRAAIFRLKRTGELAHY